MRNLCSNRGTWAVTKFLLIEFAFCQDAEEIWKAALPVISRGYCVRIVSTPAGKSGQFHRLWESGGDIWSRHRVDIYDAMADGYAFKMDEMRAGLSPDGFAQEFECQFLDENYSFFPFDLIYSCVSDDACPSAGGGDCYTGVDVGRKRDLTVIATVERLGDVLHLREMDHLEGVPFAGQRAAIERALERWAPRRVCVDASRLGMQLAEELVRAHGRRAEGVTFTQSVKEGLATFARKLFDTRRVRIPDDRKLVSDIHGIRKTITSAGNVRFDAERNDDGHSDRFWALALAMHAAGERVTDPKLVSGGRGAGFGGTAGRDALAGRY